MEENLRDENSPKAQVHWTGLKGVANRSHWLPTDEYHDKIKPGQSSYRLCCPRFVPMDPCSRGVIIIVSRFKVTGGKPVNPVRWLRPARRCSTGCWTEQGNCFRTLKGRTLDAPGWHRQPVLLILHSGADDTLAEDHGLSPTSRRAVGCRLVMESQDARIKPVDFDVLEWLRLIGLEMEIHAEWLSGRSFQQSSSTTNNKQQACGLLIACTY